MTDLPRCTAETWPVGSFRSSRCNNRARYDDNTKCGIHSAAAKARRSAKAEAKHAAWKARIDAKMLKRHADTDARIIVKAIAAGHNDPAGLCREWMEKYDDCLRRTQS